MANNTKKKAAPASQVSPRAALKQSNENKTTMLTPASAQKRWVLVDADGVVLGRLASQIVNILRGKNKASYTPSVDCGDYVVVVNAQKVRITGKKAAEKPYFYHTGYVGGIKTRTRQKLLEGKRPSRVISLAVQRMLPHGPLGRKMLTHLKVYPGTEHPHASQNPVTLNFAAQNPKNKR